MSDAITCTVCPNHSKFEGVTCLGPPLFDYEPCECCGTLVLLCAPWPNCSRAPQWWEKCRGEECPHACERMDGRYGGHVRVVHSPSRCTRTRDGKTPAQPPVVEPPYMAWQNDGKIEFDEVEVRFLRGTRGETWTLGARGPERD